MRQFNIDIGRLFKSLVTTEESELTFRISARTLHEVNRILKLFIRWVVHYADSVRLSEKIDLDSHPQDHHKTLMTRHFKYVACRLGFDSTEFDEMVLYYKSQMNMNSSVHTRREKKVGIHISASICEKYIRDHTHAYLVSDGPIVLAWIVEQLAIQLLPTYSEMIDIYTRTKRVTYKIRDLTLLLHTPTRTQTLYILDACSGKIYRGGMSHYLPESFLAKPKRTARSVHKTTTGDSIVKEFDPVGEVSFEQSEVEDSRCDVEDSRCEESTDPFPRKDNDSSTHPVTKRRYKFRPGTVSVREIRKHQDSDKCLLQHLPFTRLVRDLAHIPGPDGHKIRFNPNALKTIQSFVEYQVGTLVRNAQKIALHANREGCKGEDVLFAFEMQTGRPFESEEILDKSFHNGIMRICSRAGVKRKSDGLIEAVSRLVYAYTSDLGMLIVAYLDMKGTATVTEELAEWLVTQVRL